MYLRFGVSVHLATLDLDTHSATPSKRIDGEANVMAGKYKGRHVAGNTDRSAAESAEERPDELFEAEAKGHRTASGVKREAEELKDKSRR
ncbi:hypothetical protein [Phytoactinopolyspora mesophila]|uniref:Uncharacterized protein n=1 Tax=Phytoactinopolyspora mesophila TaxID=2650750 RepID=A0A7K3M0H6_9ACTN|nr:hypothetical protein [Phytoactinopolyspora mesophila]NDL56801.1 hypothetical protein [Phytoactinopolyspora mesophila]